MPSAAIRAAASALSMTLRSPPSTPRKTELGDAFSTPRHAVAALVKNPNAPRPAKRAPQPRTYADTDDDIDSDSEPSSPKKARKRARTRDDSDGEGDFGGHGGGNRVKGGKSSHACSFKVGNVICGKIFARNVS